MPNFLEVTNWDRYFMTVADLTASHSRDLSAKVGCIITKDNVILASGCNNIPSDCNSDVLNRYLRPEKYFYTEHAERSTIYWAAKHGVSLRNSTIYTTMFPCADCTRAIIMSGIVRLVCYAPDFEHPRFWC